MRRKSGKYTWHHYIKQTLYMTQAFVDEGRRYIVIEKCRKISDIPNGFKYCCPDNGYLPIRAPNSTIVYA